MSAKSSRRRTGELRLEIDAASEAVGPDWTAAVEPRALQLCAQARRALEFGIGSECRDEALHDLVLVDVIKEMPITLMTRPFGWDTLAVKIYELTSEGEWVRAALPGSYLVLAGIIPVILLINQMEK